MTTSEAISCYIDIAKKVFSTSKRWWKDGSFKASVFEKAMGDVVEARLGHRDGRMYYSGIPTPVCKRFGSQDLLNSLVCGNIN